MHYSASNIERSYKLFSKLAGVRNFPNITPISEPKGFSENISKITKLAYNTGGECHSVSHLNKDEIRELKEWCENDGYIKWDLESDIFHCYLEGNSFLSDSWAEDVRFIFWFDN